jgi:hypothetical protein
MKRTKKLEASAKPAVPVSARVVIHEVPAKPEEVLKRYNAFALADALHDQAIKSGEPVSARFAKHVAEQHSPASKLLEAVPHIQKARKKSATAFRGRNQKRRDEGAATRDQVRTMAKALRAESPLAVWHTQPYVLAAKIREKWRKGASAPSVKTIVRALYTIQK